MNNCFEKSDFNIIQEKIVWVGSLDVKWKHLLKWSLLWFGEVGRQLVGLVAASIRIIR